MTAVSRNAGTAQDAGGSPSHPWSSLTFAQGAADTQYASCSLTSGQKSNRLQLTNFGFTIPAGAIIDGIAVDVIGYASSGGVISEFHVYLVVGGAADTRSDKALAGTWGTSVASHVSGGSADTWSPVSPTRAQINASDFGVALEMQAAGGSSSVQVDAVSVTVTYHMPTIVTAIGQVTETETAQAFGRGKREAIGQITATGLAQALGRSKRRAIVQIVETGQARPIGRVPILQATESEMAQLLGKRKAIVQAAEAELAQSMGRAKRKAIAQVTETGLAQVVGAHFAAAALPEYTKMVLRAQPQLYIRANETTGTTLVDSSGYGRDGTTEGGPTLAVPSLISGDA